MERDGWRELNEVRGEKKERRQRASKQTKHHGHVVVSHSATYYYAQPHIHLLRSMYRKYYTGENIITKYQLKWNKICIQEPVSKCLTLCHGVFTALKICLNSFFSNEGKHDSTAGRSAAQK